jgi:hypothetical protein
MIPTSRSDRRAHRDRHRHAERDAVAATMSGLNAADYGLKPGSAVGQEIDADATGGRSKCMPARQLARSGRGRHKRQFAVSDAASRKVHRVRNAGVELLPRLVTLPCALSTRSHVLRTWRRGRGETSSVPHALFKGNGKGRPARPRPDKEQGRRCASGVCSPDAAQRNPGFLAQSQPRIALRSIRATNQPKRGLFDNRIEFTSPMRPRA